jgi:hypothetical protein
MCFHGTSFCFSSGTYIFAHAEGQGKLKKKELIKSVLDKIRSKCIQHYSPSTTVAVESTVSFKGKVSSKTNNPMKPGKFGMKMFVLSDSTNGYIQCFLDKKFSHIRSLVFKVPPKRS